MTPKYPVTIRVVDQHGQPAAGALVAVEESSAPFPDVAMVADGKGEVSIFLTEGQFKFSAHGQDGAKGYVRFAVTRGQAAIEALITLSPPANRL